MILITSIVMMSLCWLLPTQTPASERSWFLSLLESTRSALWPRSLFLTCTLRLPSWESSLQKGGAELSHPAVLIWLLSLYSKGLWSSCICSQIKPFPWHRQMASVFYTIVIPLLNPMIYSLRNQEVKNALRKAFEKCYFLSLINIKMYLVTLTVLELCHTQMCCFYYLW